MPKIEAGNIAGRFLIDGKPYQSGDYEVFTDPDDAGYITIQNIRYPDADPILNSVLVTDITDSSDTPFPDLASFYTDIEPYLFRNEGGSGLVAGVNSIEDNLVLGVTEVQLVNDVASPGNDKYYGTNESGSKGYHDLNDKIWAFTIINC